ncbi:unnamed protein product [Symbiodinium sp. CCMP2456]|nr:unnamed protein product [Symbiodinium sp. CCMP2456]
MRELFRTVVNDGDISEDKRILLQNAGVLLSQVDGKTWVSFPDNQGELKELSSQQLSKLRPFLGDVAEELKKQEAQLLCDESAGSDQFDCLELTKVPWADGITARELIACCSPDEELQFSTRRRWLEVVIRVLPSKYMIKSRVRELLNYYYLQGLTPQATSPAKGGRAPGRFSRCLEALPGAESAAAAAAAGGAALRRAWRCSRAAAGVVSAFVAAAVVGIAAALAAGASRMMNLLPFGNDPIWPLVRLFVAVLLQGQVKNFLGMIVLIARLRVVLCLARCNDVFGYLFYPFVFLAQKVLGWNEGSWLLGSVCPICFEDDGRAVEYATMHNHSWRNQHCDAHGICWKCLNRYVEMQILEEGRFNLKCPGIGCSYRLLPLDVERALEASEPERQQAALERYGSMRSASHGQRLREVVLGTAGPSERWLLEECQDRDIVFAAWLRISPDSPVAWLRHMRCERPEQHLLTTLGFFLWMAYLPVDLPWTRALEEPEHSLPPLRLRSEQSEYSGRFDEELDMELPLVFRYPLSSWWNLVDGDEEENCFQQYRRVPRRPWRLFATQRDSRRQDRHHYMPLRWKDVRPWTGDDAAAPLRRRRQPRVVATGARSAEHAAAAARKVQEQRKRRQQMRSSCDSSKGLSLLSWCPVRATECLFEVFTAIRFLPEFTGLSCLSTVVDPLVHALRYMEPFVMFVSDLTFSVGFAEGLAMIVRSVDRRAHHKLVWMSLNVGRMLREGPPAALAAAAAEAPPPAPLRVVDSPQPLPEWSDDGVLLDVIVRAYAVEASAWSPHTKAPRKGAPTRCVCVRVCI